MPNRVSIERHVAESSPDRATSEKAQQQTRYYGNSEVHKVDLAKPSSTLSAILNRRQPSETQRNPSGVPSSVPSSWDSPDTTSQFGTPQTDELPFKKECMRIVTTFLTPNSPKELNLDATVRDTIIRDLAHSTHPDIVSILEHPAKYGPS